MNDDKNILMKHNTLINAQYDITLNMNRLFVYLLYKFQKEQGSELIHTVSKKELSELIGYTNDATVDGLSKQLEELRLKNLRLLDVKDDGSYEYMSYGFINGFIYNNATDCFVITAEKRVYSLLHKYLDEGYTPINLAVWLSLKNKYAQRLYDLLRAWSGTKNIINYDVNKLRDLMMLGKKYKQYTDFRKRVLIPAIEELNATGYFEIDYSEIKKGRAIESINFKVKDLDKRKYFTKDEVVKEIPKAVQLEECAITIDEKEIPDNKVESTKTIIVDNEVFIPDETIFTKGTLRSFKKDFKSIDFKNEYMERAFDDAVMVTLDRDDVETIKATSYKFFKGTLDNKIVEYKIEEQEDLNHKKEMDMHW